MGTVYGGTGDDTYIVSDTSLVLAEFASEGDDLVVSRVGWTLDDDFERLALIGDRDIRGIGNSQENAIFGNIGDNRLHAKGGVDTIYRGDGDDRLLGGSGGDGADVFVFTEVRDSSFGLSRSGSIVPLFDVIIDFERESDLIDLSRLNASLTFVTGAFSGTRAAVRVQTSGSDSDVLVDVDGNGQFDMRIILTGATGLDATHFIL